VRSGLKEGGFTLAELVIVVVIIGILAAIAIPNFIAMQNRARDAKLEASVLVDMQDIQIAAEDYALLHGGTYPTTVAELLTVMPRGLLPNSFSRHRIEPSNGDHDGAVLFSSNGESYQIRGRGRDGRLLDDVLIPDVAETHPTGITSTQ